MKTYPVIIAIAVLFSAHAKAAPFSWVNGRVTSFTVQQPNYTTAIVNNEVDAFYWTVLAPDIVNPGREEQGSFSV